MIGDLWRFEASIERPDGYRVQVYLTVPEYRDVIEQSEVAQMAAASAMKVRSRIPDYPIAADEVLPS